MRKGLSIDVHSLESISFRGEVLAPLTIARYFALNHVLFYNGKTGNKPTELPGDGDYEIKLVDVSTEDGLKDFDDNFKILPPGLKERVCDALYQAGCDVEHGIYDVLGGYDETLEGMSIEDKKLVSDLIKDVKLRKEVEAL